MNTSRTVELDGLRSQGQPEGSPGWVSVAGRALVVVGLLLSTGSIFGALSTPTGSIVGWGWDDSGQATPPPGSDYVAISAGGLHSLALKNDGSIVGWGIDLNGVSTPPAGNDFIAIAAGFLHSLALKRDGSIVGWGDDSEGQSSPPAGNDYIAVSAGGHFNLALKSDNSIVGWGSDSNGQSTPPVGNDFVLISAGYNHALALKNDGSIISWGNGSTVMTTPPAGNDFVAVAAGSLYSLALKDDGSIVGWGLDSSGQLTPPAGSDFIDIALRDQHGLALKWDGSIVAWGDNMDGQTDVPAGYTFVAISAGYGHSLGLTGEPPPPVLEILQPPQSYTAAPGSSAALTIVTRGNPGETFQWKFGDQIVGGNSPTLALSDVQPAQSGKYTVTVAGGGDSVTSRSVTLGVKAPPYDTEKLMNISTRGQILTGSKIMIAGFVLEGSGQKDVLIRGIGPTLGGFGVNGVCTDPKLTLFRNTSPATPSIAENEAWGTLTADIPSITGRVGGFDLADGSRDAVLYMNLEPSAYTAKLSGMDGTGVGLVELYDADPDPLASTCNLANISTRGEVGTEAQILIAGFVIAGDVPKQVLIRGIGPRLADFQVDGALADPYLRILKNVGTDQLWVASNDNWSDNLNAVDIVSASIAVGAFGLMDGSKDAVVLTWLEPGVYTAKVSGVDDGTGVALVEVYGVK